MAYQHLDQRLRSQQTRPQDHKAQPYRQTGWHEDQAQRHRPCGQENYGNSTSEYDQVRYQTQSRYETGYQSQGLGEPYQGPYQQGTSCHHGHQQGRQRRPQDQMYRYDGRFRDAGYHDRQGRQAQRHGQIRDRKQPLQLEVQAMPIVKERILTERPPSPEIMAWDNPFPTFKLKKKDEKKRHASLDKGVNKSDVQDLRAPSARPHTSHGNRSTEEPGQPTSTGHRWPERQQFSSPPVPPASSMPLKKRPPPGNEVYQGPPHRYDNTAKLLSDDYPQNSKGIVDRQDRSNPLSRDQRPERPSQPQRSATMPEEMSISIAQQNAYTPQSLQQTFGYDDHNDQYSHTPEMPNFDAIPPNISRTDEDHLPKDYSQQPVFPAYQRKNYQAPLPPSDQSQPDQYTTQPMSDPSIAVAKQALQEFSFDLPIGAPSKGSSSYANTARSDPYSNGTDNPQHQQHTHEYGYGQQPIGQYPQSQLYEQYHPAPTNSKNYPTKNAMRADGHPFPPSNSGQQWSSQPISPNDQGNDIVIQQQPPTTRNRTSNRDHTLHKDHGPQYTSNHDRALAYQDYGNGFDQSYNASHPRQPAQQAWAQGTYGPNHNPKLKTPSSGQIPTQGRFDQHNNSRDGLESKAWQEGLQSPISPDALPAHPVPIRPGLMQQPTENQPTSQQALVYLRSGSGVQQQQQGPTGQRSSPRSSRGEPAPALPVTAQELQMLQQSVRNNPTDHATTLKLAKKMVEAATVLSSEGGKADAKTTAKNRERYIFDAHKIVKKLVSQGYAEATFYLADCHGQGLLGLQADAKEAFNLYTSAAKAGHPQSAYRVAVCCEMGQEQGGGTRRDPLKAMQWYRRAATMGDTPAMYKMGMILLKGLLGQPRNPREALSWLKRAAERADKDNPHAVHELGLLYESAAPNDSIVRDETYAFELFQQAADLGYKFAQFRLGSAYEYGKLGCVFDARQSIAWYSRAAAQGEHQSELALSGWYLTGAEGVLQQSDTEAYLWARNAASAGLPKAEYAMGYFTEVGIGSVASLEEAKRWYWRAAAQNFPKARERLSDLKKGGEKMQKRRVSRSAVNKQNEGECRVM